MGRRRGSHEGIKGFKPNRNREDGGQQYDEWSEFWRAGAGGEGDA